MIGMAISASPPNTADLGTDHVLGRPSVKFRKLQVLAVVTFWSAYLLKYALPISLAQTNI